MVTVTKKKDEATEPVATPAADKPKRTILTPEQRIEKLQQELEAQRLKLQAKDGKRRAELEGKVSKLLEKKQEIEVMLEGLNGELKILEARLEPAAAEVSDS